MALEQIHSEKELKNENHYFLHLQIYLNLYKNKELKSVACWIIIMLLEGFSKLIAFK